jgi:hypothetical protein
MTTTGSMTSLLTRLLAKNADDFSPSCWIARWWLMVNMTLACKVIATCTVIAGDYSSWPVAKSRLQVADHNLHVSCTIQNST